MGYLHIKNLYQKPDFLKEAGTEVYALEKVHGSSSNVSWKDNKVSFHAGGTSHANFLKIFKEKELAERFQQLSLDKVTIYGEVYGGNQQGMKDTYGPILKFVGFDVFSAAWLNVSQAEKIVKLLDLEFVDYLKGPNTPEWLDSQRDRPSTQAERNGMGSKKREGIVIRPLEEVWNPETGDRLIVKHKHPDFRETTSIRNVVDPSKIKIIEEAQTIADEYVTEMRLEHILQKLSVSKMEDTPQVITAMLEDVERESTGEVVWTEEAEKAIKKKTATLFKKKIMLGGSK